MKLSASFVRLSLSGHSWIGVAVGALMYFVCLSGTLAVFYEEFERWEQPYAPEFASYDAEGIEKTFNKYLTDPAAEVTPHMYVVLPTDAVPRARLATETAGWFLYADGTVAAPERNQWTEMLLDLHLYLHLPESWGMLLVSGLGAMLVALIVSGLFAHPRLFRDAFNLRLGGSRLLEQIDIHNRLSVWGAPFHLVIAVTGAWFGLALPFLALSSHAWFGGDQEAAVEAVFGEEPELAGEVGPVRISAALQSLRELAPDTEPLFITVHDAGQPDQFMSVAASHPRRLIYAENYLFDAQGTFLRTDGFADGEVGRQVLYSIYRLHFGHFAGLPVKFLYGLLGLALTVVSVTGVNVWLARRKRNDWLPHLWIGIVWGLPLALAISATTQIALAVPSSGILWIVILTSTSMSVALANEQRSRRRLQAALAVSLLLLVISHLATFRMLDGASAVVNAALVVLAGAMFLLGGIRQQQPGSDKSRLPHRNTPVESGE